MSTPECQICIKDRVKAGGEPQRMIALPRLTTSKRIQVYVCPDCDGNAFNLGERV